MTAFLPNVPRRKWHPSQWSIVSVKSAIGTALVIAGCGDDTISTTDQDELAETTDGYTEYTDWTEYDEYTDYSDHWDYSEYTEYTDYTDYSEYSEDWDYSEYSEWTDYQYHECYADYDCPAGYQCIDYYCVPASECRTSNDCNVDQFCDDNGTCVYIELTEQCLAPALQQIPLPAEAGGVIVALRFVQLDADPAQELVLLRDDAVVVVDGDQAVTATHGAYSLDGIAATDVDDDGVTDIVATASTKLNARVFHGDGLGGFVDSGTGPAMMLDQVHGIDWPAGGAGELLARTQVDEPVILSNLGQQMPSLEMLGVPMTEGLATGLFNGGPDDDVVELQGCMPQIQFQGGGGLGSDALGPPGPCSVAAGNFDGDVYDDVVIVRADASFSVVTVLAPVDALPKAIGLIGAYQAAVPSSFGAPLYAVVVQSGPQLELLFTDSNALSWCRGIFDELPPVLRFVVGDFDGDGDHELATVDTDGAVALWADE